MVERGRGDADFAFDAGQEVAAGAFPEEDDCDFVGGELVVLGRRGVGGVQGGCAGGVEFDCDDVVGAALDAVDDAGGDGVADQIRGAGVEVVGEAAFFEDGEDADFGDEVGVCGLQG